MTLSQQIRTIIASASKSRYQIAKETGLQGSTLQRVMEDKDGVTQIKTAQTALNAIGYKLTVEKL